ncbi:MAG: rhodanese-like domain-containing protein [Spirochaetota bacterium]
MPAEFDHKCLRSVVKNVCSAYSARGGKEAGALIGPEEAFRMVERGEAILVDVRDEGSYLDAHLAGAMLVPLPGIGESASRLASQGRTIITYCSCPAEETSSAAAAELIARGMDDVRVLRGGIRGWAVAGLPLKSGARP